MANLMRFDPFAELEDLRKQFFGEDWFTPFKGVTLPTTDVYEKDSKLVVEAHLPNFDDHDVDVHVENGALVIQAQRHEKDEDKDKKFVVRESASSLYRPILLPERADTDKIEAHLDDGVLKVMVPLQALPEPKKITVSSKPGKK
ncbi:MAG TPA: Hsp20/alpha crystallin family protein [Verrucomicrobiae bacterium]|nr:Hsp20/alpha crystallin family protein [Verrucomicrobiae bacterium]